MLVLNKIAITESARAVALFYFDTADVHRFNPENGFTRTGKQNIRSKHCEFFAFDALNSALLNENSIVLRFNDRCRKRPRALKLTLNDERQIDSVADLLELCLRQGLSVREHFANISIKQIIQTKD